MKFIYGTDGCRIVNRVRELIAGNAVNRFDIADASDIDRLENTLKTASLFQMPELVVVSQPFQESKRLYELLKKDPAQEMVIYETESATVLKKADLKLFGLLTKKPWQSECLETMEPTEAKAWLFSAAKELGVELEPLAAAELIRRTQTTDTKKKITINSWWLWQELNKLADYARGNSRRKIASTDVALLTREISANSVFDFTDALAGRETTRALALLQNYARAGIDPNYLFSMAIWQFRLLVRVMSLMPNRSSTISDATGYHSFAVGKAMKHLNRFEPAKLLNAYKRLSILERDARSGAVSMIDGLTHFILSIA